METSTRQSRYPTMTLQTSATMEKSSQSGSCRGSLLVTHNTLKENSHIQQTPSCYLDVKQSRVYMNFDTMFYFNLYFHCFYTLHIRQQFTKYLSFYFLLLQVWSLRTLRPPSPCRVPSWGSSSSSLGLAPSWAPVCWQSFP